MKGGVWKSAEKAEGAHQLLDFHFDFQKMGRGVKRQTESWGCPPTPRFATSMSQKMRGRVGKAHRKLRVPTNSCICHFDFRKMEGEEWESRQKGEGAHHLLDLPLQFRKNGGGGVRKQTERWGCPADPGFLTSISEKCGAGWKSTQEAEGAYELLDFTFRFRKIWGGCVKKHKESWGCPRIAGQRTSISEKFGGEGREKAQRKLRLPTTSWICHFNFEKMDWGSEKADRKVRVPSRPRISHFDVRKMRGRIEKAHR